MKLTQQDWQRLQPPLLGMGLALVLLGLLAFYAEAYESEQAAALQVQQAEFNQARQKYMSSGQERETIAQYLPLYQALISQGFVGEEQRIEWIAQLRQLHLQHKLFSIQYQIGEQETISPSYLPSMGSFSLHRSIMKLDMDLLHEEDLLTLLNGLRQQTAPFIVRECEINRPIGSKINTTLLTNNAKARCEIDWITLREPHQEGSP